MIVGFRDAETEKIWNGLRSRKLPLAISKLGALRKLRLINAAKRVGRFTRAAQATAWKPWTAIEPAKEHPYQSAVPCLLSVDRRRPDQVEIVDYQVTKSPTRRRASSCSKTPQADGLSQNGLAREIGVPPAGSAKSCRQARDHRRHRPATGPVLWRKRWIFSAIAD